MSSSIGRRLPIARLLSVVCLAAGVGYGVEANAQTRVLPQGDLFYNYYQPGTCYGGVPAQMYPSPLPVPARVGHTYITYQPLLPHEWMYPHSRTYRRYDPQGGFLPTNVTRVRWW